MKGASAPPLLRILLVDDHGLVREALSILLERDDGMKVVGSAATGEEAVLAARRLRPDLIVMDLMLPDLNGIDATQRILGEFPLMRIIVLSASHTPQHVSRALRAGAHGYVVKTASGAELVQAHQATDVLVQPDVDEIEIRDWKAFDQAVEIGYRATIEALDKLSRPVVDLRRRASLEESALRAPQPRTSAS